MHPLVQLAKKAVEEYVRDGTIMCVPEESAPEMRERAGAFVSLKKHGELRGCIGTFMPARRNVAEEIIRNAIAAATQDPRFDPVDEEELVHLTYSVDVLSPPERVRDTGELDHQRYGVIVAKGGRRGLLLPALEGVGSVQEQLRIAKMKACIGPDEEVDIYRFEVRRYH